MRIAVDRALGQGELQAAELLVQVAATCQQEITVLASDAGGCGKAGLGDLERSKARQVARAAAKSMECGEQLGQVGICGCRLAAGDRLPERDWAAVHQQRLIDVVVDADCRDVCAG